MTGERDAGDQDGGDADSSIVIDEQGGIRETTDEQVDMLMQVGADILDRPKVCSGWDHACAIDRDGKPWCWGIAEPKIDPPEDLPPLVTIACGRHHTCAIGDDKQIYCWGFGMSDDPNDFDMMNVGQSVVPGGEFLELSIGPNSLTTCGIHTDNTLECWGAGDRNAPASSRAALGQGLPPRGQFWGLTSGDAHACAIDLESGAAVCWGGGGAAGCAPPLSFACGQALAPPDSFVQLAAGSYHTCGLLETGETVCWGLGQVDDNCNPDSGSVMFDCGQSLVPTSSPGIMGDFMTLYSGTIHTCVVTDLYEAVCWGWYGYGQTNVPDADYTQLAPGDTHTCGLRTDGDIDCWGFSDAVENRPRSFPGVY